MILSIHWDQYLQKKILNRPHWMASALAIIIIGAICINFGFDLRRWAYIKNFIALVREAPLNPQLCCYYWSDIAYQTTDLLMQRIQVWDFVHQANMRFRIFLPLLWMVFSSAGPIYLLQLVLGVGQLYMTMRLIYTLTQDKVQAIYFTFGFAGLYSGAAFYLEFYGFGDAFAYIFMTAALFFRKPFMIFLTVFLAALVDERALVNTSFILLFHWLIDERVNRMTLLMRPFYFNSRMVAVLLAAFLYIAARLWLTLTLHLKTPYGGPSPFFFIHEASKFFGIRLWTGFESFWLLIVMMLAALYWRRAYLFLGVMLCMIGVTIVTFLLQGDHTRTAAYAFPLLFVAMVIAQDTFSRSELRFALLLIGLLSAIFFPVQY